MELLKRMSIRPGKRRLFKLWPEHIKISSQTSSTSLQPRNTRIPIRRDTVASCVWQHQHYQQHGQPPLHVFLEFGDNGTVLRAAATTGCVVHRTTYPLWLLAILGSFSIGGRGWVPREAKGFGGTEQKGRPERSQTIPVMHPDLARGGAGDRHGLKGCCSWGRWADIKRERVILIKRKVCRTEQPRWLLRRAIKWTISQKNAHVLI